MARQQAKAANGQTQQMTPEQMQAALLASVKEQRVYKSFMSGVEDDGEGRRVLHVFLPDGIQLSFPFSAESARAVGTKLLSTKVDMAGVDDVAAAAAAARATEDIRGR